MSSLFSIIMIISIVMVIVSSLLITDDLSNKNIHKVFVTMIAYRIRVLSVAVFYGSVLMHVNIESNIIKIMLGAISSYNALLDIYNEHRTRQLFYQKYVDKYESD
jgi:hypothetical protein